MPFQAPIAAVVFQPGKSVLVTDFQRNALFQIKESTFAVSSGLKSGNAPLGIAMNHTSQAAYVAESGNNTVIAYTK